MPINTENNRVSLLSKLYIWSVVVEPLLFFNSGHIFGIGFSLSRYLQFIVIISFAARSISRYCSYNNYKFKIFNTIYPPYRIYSLYIILTCLAGIYGITSGAYIIPNLLISQTLKVSVYRPFFEYSVSIYYFVYFVVLFKYMIKNNADINYFFKIFNIVFYFALITGLLDYLLMLIIKGYEGLPRNLSDLRSPGLRFHGIIGEPRDAFVYLILGICVLVVKDIWYSKRMLSIPKLIMIILALFLTESASGVMGIIFSIIIIIIYFVPKMKIKNIFAIIIILSLMFMFSFYSIKSSERVFRYYTGFTTLYTSLESETHYSYRSIDSDLRVVANNIYPLWHRWREILELNIIPLILGTGLGSSSVINNYYYGVDYKEYNSILNPNANIIRIIYESGVLGLLIYISAFIRPIKRTFLSKQTYLKILFCMIIILGSSFAHRTVTPFLFLGLILNVLERYYYSFYFTRNC